MEIKIKNLKSKTLFGLLFLILTNTGFTQEMALIKNGEYIPFYGGEAGAVQIDDFLLDKYPVTQAEYLNFVRLNPTWSKSKIVELFADDNYLNEWATDFELGKTINKNSPVTNVSWFAAKKYCECLGKRLPTLDEWEYVAMADEEVADARIKESYNQHILSWYEAPNTNKNQVGSTFENYWGVYDMHGLVWEWTQDFNTVMLSGESRTEAGTDKNLFCGSGSIGASDLMNYAAFMRYAFRSSVKARYSTNNLGFRCAQNVEKIK